MRSHRFALTTLALLGTVLATGCGSGRDSDAFLPDAAPATASAPPADTVPQVVVAGPRQALVEARDAAAADAQASRNAAAEAEAKRKATRRKLRQEREKAKRAAAREALLQAALLAETKKNKKPKTPAVATEVATPKPDREPVSAPISASDTGSQLIAERNRRSDAEARAAVLRFHELLDNRDVRSCDMLTEKLLTAFYGEENPAERCRAAASSITASVSVVIAESRTYGKVSSIAVVTKIGDQEFPQTMHLVLVDGTWLVDAVERRS